MVWLGFEAGVGVRCFADAVVCFLGLCTSYIIHCSLKLCSTFDPLHVASG
jgi:hypothetical protein